MKNLFVIITKLEVNSSQNLINNNKGTMSTNNYNVEENDNGVCMYES